MVGWRGSSWYAGSWLNSSWFGGTGGGGAVTSTGGGGAAQDVTRAPIGWRHVTEKEILSSQRRIERREREAARAKLRDEAERLARAKPPELAKGKPSATSAAVDRLVDAVTGARRTEDVAYLDDVEARAAREDEALARCAWRVTVGKTERRALVHATARLAQDVAVDVADSVALPPITKASSRAYTGHFAQPHNAAALEAFAVRAYGSGPDDRRVFRARTAGLPVADCPECDATAKGEARDVAVSDVALSRNALTRGKLSRMARALADGVRQDDKATPIRVVERHDGTGDGPRYVVAPGEGNHRVAHLMLSRKAGTFPVSVVTARAKTTAKQLATVTVSRGAEWTPSTIASRRESVRERVAARRKGKHLTQAQRTK